MRLENVANTEVAESIYKAYSVLPDSWIAQNWHVSHEHETMWPKTSHFEIEPYGFAKRRLISAILFNFNSSRKLQFEQMGFDRPKCFTSDSCEVINFFTTRRVNPVSMGLALRNVYDSLHYTRNTDLFIVTFGAITLQAYQRFGWRLIGVRTYQKKSLFLIKMELPSTKAIKSVA